MKFPARVYWSEHDWIAECPLLPGCLGDGATEEDALRVLVDSIMDFLTPDLTWWAGLRGLDGEYTVVDVPLVSNRVYDMNAEPGQIGMKGGDL